MALLSKFVKDYCIRLAWPVPNRLSMQRFCMCPLWVNRLLSCVVSVAHLITFLPVHSGFIKELLIVIDLPLGECKTCTFKTFLSGEDLKAAPVSYTVRSSSRSVFVLFYALGEASSKMARLLTLPVSNLVTNQWPELTHRHPLPPTHWRMHLLAWSLAKSASFHMTDWGFVWQPHYKLWSC